MNHKQRRKVSKTLRAYREKTKREPKDIAAQLGWPLAFYLEAEAGKAGLSQGQYNDVRELLRKEIKAATVRDSLRAPAKGKRIPLIGVPRIVEHKPSTVEHLEDHMNRHGRGPESV
jgi:hypothetical protein